MVDQDESPHGRNSYSPDVYEDKFGDEEIDKV